MVGQAGMLRSDARVIERDDWYEVVSPSPQFNEIVFSRIAAEDADRTIAEVIVRNHSEGRPVKWCVGPWTEPADFGQRLARRGFTSWDVRGMGIDTSALARVPGTREAVTDDDVLAYVDCSMRGWEMPESDHAVMRSSFLAAVKRDRCETHLFLAESGGACVGSGAVILRGDYGYLVGAQVFERARGKGLYHALIAERLAFLRERGIDYAVTHARETTSAPRLERLGFETIFRSRCYLLEPP